MNILHLNSRYQNVLGIVLGGLKLEGMLVTRYHKLVQISFKTLIVFNLTYVNKSLVISLRCKVYLKDLLAMLPNAIKELLAAAR
jgi:hypothetical protein